jgi:hypothetical protein
MTKRLITLMAALLMLGFVVAGCGDDENSGDSGDTAAQTVTDTDTDVVTDDEVVTDTETETETVTDETDTDADNGGAVVPENLQQAVQQCKDNIDKASQLSADTKDSLQEICDKAGSGNEEDIREASAEVCKKVVGDSVPKGTPGRDQALAACDKAGGQ